MPDRDSKIFKNASDTPTKARRPITLYPAQNEFTAITSKPLRAISPAPSIMPLCHFFPSLSSKESAISTQNPKDSRDSSIQASRTTCLSSGYVSPKKQYYPNLQIFRREIGRSPIPYSALSGVVAHGVHDWVLCAGSFLLGLRGN